MSKGGWELGFAILCVMVSSSVGVFGTAPLSGSFEMSIAFNPSAPTLAGLVQTDSDTYSKLILSYALSEWVFKNTTSFDLSGLSAVRFEANGELAVFALSSKLDFYPGTSVEKEYSNLIPSAVHRYDLGQVYSVIWLKVENVSATKVTCDGFNYVSFKVSHIETGLCWLDLSGTVKFTTSDKTLTMTPKLVLANDSCIKVYGKLVTGDSTMEITGVSIYGIGLKHTWNNGVSFESLSSLDSSYHFKENYWEKFVITSKGDACCGGKLKFEVATYFQATHDTLFDWAETDIDLSVGITRNFTASTGIEVDTTGFTKLVIAFKTTWQDRWYVPGLTPLIRHKRCVGFVGAC